MYHAPIGDRESLTLSLAPFVLLFAGCGIVADRPVFEVSAEPVSPPATARASVPSVRYATARGALAVLDSQDSAHNRSPHVFVGSAQPHLKDAVVFGPMSEPQADDAIAPFLRPFAHRAVVWRTLAALDDALSHGMTTSIVPFRRSVDMTRLDATIVTATARGAKVILRLEGGLGTADRAFASVWQQVAARYRADPNVAYELATHLLWPSAANAAVKAIRAAGSHQLIIVPGDRIDGVVDPENNVVFDPHLDCNPTRLSPFVDWLRREGNRGFISGACAETVEAIDAARDVLVGWSWNRVEPPPWPALAPITPRWMDQTESPRSSSSPM